MTAEKLVYLIWAPAELDPAALRRRLLDEVAPRMLAAGALQLAMDIADPESRMRSPSPDLTGDPPIRALVSAWLEEPGRRAELERILAGAGLRSAGYLVDETVYTDYGDNRHAPPRAWPDGERSPGLVQVTLLERPRRLTREAWMRRWHGRMSPVSEAIQPRTRYVRNAVREALTPGPPIEGIVEEAWPSRRHVRNPFLYFGARTPWGLVWNLVRILAAVTSFLSLFRIRSVMMGEYLLRTDPHVARARRSPWDLDRF